MKDKISNAPTFAVIGKPNHGKSSIISALMMDDRIQVASNTGTTKVSSKYSYKYEDMEICNFYDTPGFEQSKTLWGYIRKSQSNIVYGNNIFYEYIEHHKKEISFRKDIAILQAILESDYVIFVIDISKMYTVNTYANELKIMEYLSKNKPILILLNKIGSEDHSLLWKEQLHKYTFRIFYEFDPFDTNHKNIIDMYQKLYSIDSSLKGDKQITQILRKHQNHFDDTLKQSAYLISESLYEMLSLEYRSSRYNKKEKEEQIFLDKITIIENKYQQHINKIWGYYELEIGDSRTKIGTKDSLKLKLSKTEKALSAALLGAITVGTTTGILSGGLGAPGGAAIGGMCGGVVGYFSDGKLIEIKQFNNDALYRVSKSDIDFTIIMLTRALEYTHTIMNHSHANRDKLEICKTKKYDFEKKYVQTISTVHNSFVSDKQTHTNKKVLQDMVFVLLQNFIYE